MECESSLSAFIAGKTKGLVNTSDALRRTDQNWLRRSIALRWLSEEKRTPMMYFVSSVSITGLSDVFNIIQILCLFVCDLSVFIHLSALVFEGGMLVMSFYMDVKSSQLNVGRMSSGVLVKGSAGDDNSDNSM